MKVEPRETRWWAVVALALGVACGGSTGERGPAGEQGPPGATGPQGAPGTPAPAYQAGNGIAIDGGSVISVVFGDAAGTALEGNSTAVIHNATPEGPPSIDVAGPIASASALKVTSTQDLTTCPTGTPLVDVSEGAFNPFQLYPDGTVVMSGFEKDLGAGLQCAPPVSGAGTRFMWIPSHGSLRFGRVAVGGSDWDLGNLHDFTFAGGNSVIAKGYGAFAFGDLVTVTSTVGVGFGSSVLVSGTAGFSAGASNVCSGFACTALGYHAEAGGQGSTALGYRVTAGNDYSTALGYRVSNDGHTGTFIWGDNSTTTDTNNQADNEFRVRASGGIALRTNATSSTGCTLPSGSGVFSCTSSRTLKENFQAVRGEDVLARLSQLPVTEWSYIADPTKARHVGPVAQDFYQAFKLGTSDTSIGIQDLAGVALAAAKALDARTAQLEARTRQVETLERQVGSLQTELDALRQRLDRLDAKR